MLLVPLLYEGPAGYTGATPSSTAQYFLAVGNGAANGLGVVLLFLGSQSCPAPEVALMALLETGLAPVLVYLVTLNQRGGPEKPSTDTMVAGGLIIACLAAHTLVDARAARRAAALEAAAAGGDDLELAKGDGNLVAEAMAEAGGCGAPDGLCCPVGVSCAAALHAAASAHADATVRGRVARGGDGANARAHMAGMAVAQPLAFAGDDV